MVRYRNSGGLWLASKPEDVDYARRIFREERTLDDLLIMEPGGEYRFNVLDYERKKGADTRELTQALMTFGETLERTEGAGGGDRDPYWQGQTRRRLHNGIEIMTRAKKELDPWDLQCFLEGAPVSQEEIGTAKWQAGFHSQMLEAASGNATTPIQKHDYKLAEQYFLGENARLNDRTKTSIDTSTMGLLHVFNTGLVRDMLATTTNISPDVLEQRKWWFVNAPIVPGDATATFVNTAIKYAVQRSILRRKAGKGDPMLVIWNDEYPQVCNSYDSAFLAQARSHKGFLVALSQSIHALFATLHGKGGEHQTEALLTNFGTVIVHNLGDAKSAEYAASLLGKRRELFINTSSNPSQVDPWDLLMGRSNVTVNASEHYEYFLQPAVFLGGLRCGGPPDKVVDGIVIRGGQPFRSGENWLCVEFKQR
jgi:hypothetical protein